MVKYLSEDFHDAHHYQWIYEDRDLAFQSSHVQRCSHADYVPAQLSDTPADTLQETPTGPIERSVPFTSLNLPGEPGPSGMVSPEKICLLPNAERKLHAIEAVLGASQWF